jgi:hypothetical protein
MLQWSEIGFSIDRRIYKKGTEWDDTTF